MQPAPALSSVARLGGAGEHGRGGLSPRRFATQCSTAGTIPWGRTKTITIIKAPYRIHCMAGAAKSRTITSRNPKMTPPTIGPAKVPLPPVITIITIVTV
jgi:hypothetical protein